ncbi:MAG: HlyD family secretion protein [Pirellulales bacterium]|nr:HlyD family secretion protein [Pirellulales bacterium]
MPDSHVITLGDCSKFRQTIEARPPALAHVGVWLCVLTVALAVAWAALTKADIVVRATGRVRPLDLPTQVFSAVSPHVEGRVAEVCVQEGDVVGKGDILLKLDTQRLDHQIAKTQQVSSSAQAELAKLAQLDELQARQYEIAHGKAVAELEQAVAELARLRRVQQTEIRQAEIELAKSRDHDARLQKLIATRAVTEQQLVESAAKVQLCEESLRRARLPLDEGHLAVLRQAIELVKRDHAVRTAELAARRIAKQGEAETAGKELSDLERQLQQAVLRSPIDGIVTKGKYHVGDVVPSGAPVYEVAARDGFCFESLITSEDVGLLREGLPSRVKFDAYDYQLYGSLGGNVSFISPDTQPAVALAPENATSGGALATMSRTGQRQSTGPGVTYRVRVSLAGDQVGKGLYQGAVKLGMAGKVEIVTDRRTILSILFKRIRSSISLG